MLSDAEDKAACVFFFHPDCTVGSGFDRLSHIARKYADLLKPCGSQTRRNCFRFTASREFHPTPKNFFLYSVRHCNTDFCKMQPCLTTFFKSAACIQINHIHTQQNNDNHCQRQKTASKSQITAYTDNSQHDTNQLAGIKCLIARLI